MDKQTKLVQLLDALQTSNILANDGTNVLIKSATTEAIYYYRWDVVKQKWMVQVTWDI